MTTPTFITWRHADRQFLAIDKHDGDGWHVMDDTGANYGAWLHHTTFRAFQRRGTVEAQPLAGCVARPSVRASAPGSQVWRMPGVTS
jgi:hypothetical protein